MHTDWTDGADTLEAMIARPRPPRLRVPFHLRSLSGPGRGLDPARLRAQRAAVRALGERYNIRTLCSAEVDIRADGTLDCDDAVLAELDIVVASVHADLQPVARRDDARG